MILRKPYAFLIKYFKLIHTILVVMMCFLLYRTNLILNFLGEYISSTEIITGKDFTGSLFNTWLFYLPFIIIIILGILLGVMIYKKKPYAFYIINILVMISVLVFYNIGYNFINTLEAQIIETRTIRLIRDLYTIIILLQGLSLIFTFVRATGFDIKKFDFRRDLQELDITEEDAEEFEVAVNFESQLYKREFRKNIRFAKYIYIENKFIINGLILIIFSIICFIVYMNLTIYNKTYRQGDTFSASEFNMSVSDCYITNEDYRGNKITNNHLLIVKVNLMAKYENITINNAKTELKIKNNTYHPINNYNSKLVDLGNIYTGQVINTLGFEEKLLVYEVPSDLIEEKIYFSYLDNLEDNNKLNPKHIKVKLEPYNLDLQNKQEIVELDNNIVLNDNVLDSVSINLSGFEMKEKFKLDYQFCRKGNCYDSSEYLNPVLNTNYDKALLKIDGVLIDENKSNDNIKNLYSVIKYFGKIKYQTSRKVNYYNLSSKIEPKKISLENSYYLEIPKEIMSADKVSLVIDVRGNFHEYVIK